MKKIILSLLFVFISCGDFIPSFNYEDNTRIIIEGRLIDQDGIVLSNQSAILASYSNDQQIILQQVVSDGNGKIFISSPKGNNSVFIEFENKNILDATYYSNLIKNPSFSEDWIGFLVGSYYDFGDITLEEIN